eukprot:6131219-Amphidinium_carterae.1
MIAPCEGLVPLPAHVLCQGYALQGLYSTDATNVCTNAIQHILATQTLHLDPYASLQSKDRE